MKARRYSSVLFDLDGTLLDTLEDLADSTNRALASLGFPAHPVDSYRYLVGEGVVMLITRALPEDRRDPATIEACLGRYRAIYAENWNAKTRLYDGIADLLDALSARALKLAVLSNKPHEFTFRCVEAYLSHWRFSAVLGETGELPRKPSPAGALEIARRLDEPVARFLYVGDTATDMLTAASAGMYPAGVLWGFRPREELERSGARSLLARPMDLMRLIE